MRTICHTAVTKGPALSSAGSAISEYSSRQRLLSASLSLAMSGSVTVTCAQANAPQPVFIPAHGPTTGLQHSFFSHGFPAPVHSPVAHTGPTLTWHPRNALFQNVVSQVSGNNDLNLSSSASLFSPGGLAGFHSIILDIGGKHEQVSLDSKLTAAELIAAEQVSSGGKQDITINARGIATGGYFDLNGATLSALDGAIGGPIGSLVVGRGVHAIDSLANLSLLGSLTNMGSITIGPVPGAKGTVVDTISAANIYNGVGGTIESSSVSGASTSAGITIETPGVFANSGVVTSGGALNINAPSVTNSGLITAQNGNINIANGGGKGDLLVTASGGTFKTLNGNINFNQAGNNSSGDITLNGGNYLSKQVNFNAGTGTINANVDEITGVVNGTAGASHIMAATNNLNLGNICVSGDPTYYNSAGDITISGNLSGNPDLALIASGNIIANGGSLLTDQADTGTGNAGNLLLVAGAFFAPPLPTPPASPPAGDTTNTITIGNSGNLPNTGSKSGGYIDMSGITLTGSKSNTPLAQINSSSSTGNAGNITIIAYAGSGKNSGSIVATGTAKQAGSTTVNASAPSGTAGAVLLIGGGTTISAKNINGGTIEISAAQPIIGGAATTMSIKNGTVQAGSGSFQAGVIQSTKVTAAVGSASAPINVDGTSLSLASENNAKSVNINLTALSNSLSTASLSPGATLTLKAPAGSLDITGAVSFTGLANKANTINITAGNGVAVDGSISGAGTANITATSGDISGAGQIQATTINFVATTGNITATTAATSISVTAGSASGNVTISENATAGNVTNILTSNLAAGMNFSIFPTQQTNVTGIITDIDGTFAIHESGTATPIGINIAGNINVGTISGAGAVNLITDSASIIGSKVITAPIIFLVPGGAVGSVAKPLLTDTDSLQVIGLSNQSGAPVIVKDSNIASLDLAGVNANGGAITVTSAARNLTVDTMTFGNVTLQDTFAKTGQGASIVLAGQNSSSQIGDGLGTVSITSAAATIDTSPVGLGIVSASVSLNSTMSNIGSTAMAVAAPTLAASAAKGSVNVSDSLAATLNAGKALNTYTINATGLTVAGAITCGTITLQTTAGPIVIDANIGTASSAHVDLISANGISQGNAKVVVSGQNVLLQTLSGADIGSPAFGGQNILSKALNLILDGNSGTDVYVTQTGLVGLSGSTPLGSGSLNLTASGTIFISANTQFDTLFLVAPSVSVAPLSQVTCSVLDAQTNSFIVPTLSKVSVGISADFFLRRTIENFRSLRHYCHGSAVCTHSGWDRLRQGNQQRHSRRQ